MYMYSREDYTYHTFCCVVQCRFMYVPRKKCVTVLFVTFFEGLDLSMLQLQVGPLVHR